MTIGRGQVSKLGRNLHVCEYLVNHIHVCELCDQKYACLSLACIKKVKKFCSECRRRKKRGQPPLSQLVLPMRGAIELRGYTQDNVLGPQWYMFFDEGRKEPVSRDFVTNHGFHIEGWFE